MFMIPILYIIFNRLDTVTRTFDRIKRIQPANLYIAADGPRSKEEKRKCQEVRDYVLSNIDWNCNINKLFRKENLGCGKAVSGAITWFFNNVDKGIILEDDCLPDRSFFPYCSELLEKYENNSKVMHIAGYNPLGILENGSGESYYFGNRQCCWGWASWARAWNNYSFDIDDEYKYVLKTNEYFDTHRLRKHWESIFKSMREHKIDTWDYQWTYKILERNGVCINPTRNLVQNIGMNSGTHYEGSGLDSESIPSYSLSFPMIHPAKIKVNRELEKKLKRQDVPNKIKALFQTVNRISTKYFLNFWY